MKFLVLPGFNLLGNNEKNAVSNVKKEKSFAEFSPLKCINTKANNRNNFKIPILGSPLQNQVCYLISLFISYSFGVKLSTVP